MKSKLFVFIFLAIFLIGMTNLANAEVEFWQQKMDMGNGTIQNHIYLQYSKGGFGITDDYVSGNNPYEVYLLYNIYVQKWNTDNPNYRVDRCEFIVKFWGSMQNTTAISFNQSYTQADSDIMSAKYFMKLNDGDGMIADQICYFQNPNYHDLYVPVEMQLVTPSWECKACQYYEWSLVERDIIKAKSIGDNVVTISSYIKKLFMLNFEIWLALFWFALILMIFISIGLLFIIVYYFYLYLKRIVK